VRVGIWLARYGLEGNPGSPKVLLSYLAALFLIKLRSFSATESKSMQPDIELRNLATAFRAERPENRTRT
jgi:hypothetical protein